MPSIIFFGTSAACPTKARNVSSYAVKLDEGGKTFLVDCGEGTQHQIQKTTEVSAVKIDAIFITHMHGDHLFGIQGLLASMSLFGRKDPVKVFGPVGIQGYLDNVMKASVTYLTYPLEVVELEEQRITPLGNIHGMDVTAYPLKHKVTCFGFLMEEPIKRGKLDSQKAKQLGATGKDMGLLSNGQDVTLANGTVIKSSDVVGEPRKGKKLLLLGDTSDSSTTIEHAMECDVVVHEATYDRSLEEKAREGGHSTSTMAGKFANEIRAKKLIITHFSQKYHGLGQDKNKNEVSLTVDDLHKEAQAECPNTVVIAAEELKKYDI